MFTHHAPARPHFPDRPQLTASPRLGEALGTAAVTTIPESQRMLNAYRSVVFNAELHDRGLGADDACDYGLIDDILTAPAQLHAEIGGVR